MSELVINEPCCMECGTPSQEGCQCHSDGSSLHAVDLLLPPEPLVENAANDDDLGEVFGHPDFLPHPDQVANAARNTARSKEMARLQAEKARRQQSRQQHQQRKGQDQRQAYRPLVVNDDGDVLVLPTLRF